MNKNMELATYRGEVVEVLERGPNLSRVRYVNTDDADFSVRTEDLSIYPQKKQAIVEKAGVPYKPVRDVRSEVESWVIDELSNWRSVFSLVLDATQKFSDLTIEGKPFFNQGGFDPLFVVSTKNPGALLKGGLVIYRMSESSDGARFEFKSYSAATLEEIASCRELAASLGKFIPPTIGEAVANHN